MIITLSDYKSLTGTTVAIDDALLTALLPGVNDLVERYCDRHFDLANYRIWQNYYNPIILPEYPINKILMIGAPQNVANLSWATTDDFSVEIREDGVVITDTGHYALTSQTFLFSAYPTLLDLKTKIEDDWDIIVTIVSGYDTLNSMLLKTGTGQAWYGAIRCSVDFRILDDSQRCLELYGPWFSYCCMVPNLDNNLFVMWSAGYTSTSMPKGLQLTTAYILRDWLNFKKMGSKGLLKSEQITHYQYQNFSPNEFNVHDLIDMYKGDLDFYTKKQI